MVMSLITSWLRANPIVSPRRVNIISMLICILAAVIVTMFYGHDANWDLRNYHLYLGFAFLDGRFDSDLAPANLQSLFNPLLDVPYYWTVRSFGLQAASILQSMYFAAYAFVLWKINQRLFVSTFTPERYARNTNHFLYPIFATLLGCTAAGTLSQSATTFNEIQQGLLVLLGVFVVVRTLPRKEFSYWPFACAGGLLGAAAGLKLTAFVFAPAFVIALLFAYGVSRSIKPILVFCIAWGVGLLVLYGAWGMYLYDRFESPIFPLYNSIFKSPWYPEMDFKDVRFFPESLAEWVAYPFNWAATPSVSVTEPFMRDPRLAIYLVCVIGLITIFWNRLKQSSIMRFLFVFGISSYVIWIIQFSYLRYAVATEGIAASMIILFIACVVSGLKGARDQIGLIAAGLAFMFAQSVTHYPEWGRIPFSVKSYEFEIPDVPDGSLFLLAGPPNSYIAPFIPASDLSFVGISQMTLQARGYKFYDETIRRIQDHKGPIRVLMRGDAIGPELQSEFGISIPASSCEAVKTNIEPAASDIQICHAFATS